jgi:hypothetical protein
MRLLKDSEIKEINNFVILHSNISDNVPSRIEFKVGHLKRIQGTLVAKNLKDFHDGSYGYDYTIRLDSYYKHGSTCETIITDIKLFEEVR